MNKYQLFFFTAFCLLFSIAGFTGNTCEHCGYEYEGACPFDDQHQLLLNHIEALIDPPNVERRLVFNPSINEGHSMLAESGAWGGILLNPLRTEVAVTVLLHPVTPATHSEMEYRTALTAKSESLKKAARKQIKGSDEWCTLWQQLYDFAIEHSYEIHCLYDGVIALTQLRKLDQALALNNYVRDEAKKLNYKSFLKVINHQDLFIRNLIQNRSKKKGY